MTFIPSGIRVGDKIRLTRNVKVLKGTFTRGHVFTITSIGERGPDGVDEEGEYIRELFNPDWYERIGPNNE